MKHRGEIMRKLATMLLVMFIMSAFSIANAQDFNYYNQTPSMQTLDSEGPPPEEPPPEKHHKKHPKEKPEPPEWSNPDQPRP